MAVKRPDGTYVKPSTNIWDYPARFQFGQAGAPCEGQSCCTDTCIQMIGEYYLDRTYDLNAIRRLAERDTRFDERRCTGLNGIEVLNALKNMGITHYRKASGVDASDVNKMKNIGPVIVGVHYGTYPNRPGRCHSPAGIHKAEVGGRTDCGFTGAHAILAIASREHKDAKGKYLHTDIVTRDPDHNSPSRPEEPNGDRMRLYDLQITMRNLPKYTAFTQTYAVYPTKKKK